MDLTENVRRIAEQLEQAAAPLDELADELHLRHEKGEITDEEWDHWRLLINDEIIEARTRLMRELRKSR